MPDPKKNKKTAAKPKSNAPGRKEKEQRAKDLSVQAARKAMSKSTVKKSVGAMQKANDKTLLKKASPEKKAAAKAKAIEGGMPQNVANKVFKMSMGSKSAPNKNSDSAFSMYSEKVIQMSPIFMTDPPVKTPPRNTLYSYETTNTNVKRSGGGGESSNVQKKSTSNLADYQKGLKDLGPDFKPTAAQTAAANKKVAELKKKDAQNAEFNKNISKSNKSSVEKSVDKKKVVLGDQTQAEILKKGEEFKSNRKSKVTAERGAAMDRAQKDSIRVAKAYLNKIGGTRKLTQRDMRTAATEGGKAGTKILNEAYSQKELGKFIVKDQKLFTPKEASDAFRVKPEYNRPAIQGYNKMSKRQQKKAVEKAGGPRKLTGYSAGSLGAIPRLSDLQMNIGDKALKFYNRKK